MVWLVPIRSTGGFECVNMCGMPVLTKLVVLSVICVVWLLQFGPLLVLIACMCGMAVTIWSTCGLERKYVWYGCYNLVNLWF